MRKNLVVTLDSELINRIDDLYLEELRRMLERKRIKNQREYSKSKFVERLIEVGLTFKDVDRKLIELIEEYRKRKRMKSLSEATNKILKLGLEAAKFLP